jgi:uncharacterized protein (DUF2141 family)
MKISFLLLITSLSTLFNNNYTTSKISKTLHGDIVINVDDIEINKGSVFVGLFTDQATFRKIDKVFMYEKVEANSKRKEVIIKNVPFDEYAIVIFQDYNDNKKFDTSFIGIPKEPFGFSTNYKVTTKAPAYQEVSFEHKKEDTEMTVKLQSF